MELLYVWINQSENNIIEKQGFNFSPKFQFDVNCRDTDIELSEDNSWSSCKSIFKSNVIENVTAVVGKNGCGKTTLLKSLAALNCSKVNDEKRPKFERLFIHRKSRSECILIFRDNDTVTIYQNLADRFINQTKYKAIDVTSGEIYRDILIQNSDFMNITKVFISNSGYAYGTEGISSQKSISDIFLTPMGLKTIASVFYDRQFEFGRTYAYVDDVYHKVINIIKTNLQEKERIAQIFQEVCDVIYLNKLLEEGIFKSYSGKVSTKLKINCDSISDLIGQTNDDEINEISKRVNEILGGFDGDEIPQIRMLCINLMYEWLLKNKNYNLGEIHSLDELNKELGSVNEISTYFSKALEEINELKQILALAHKTENVVPLGDFAYDYSMVLDYSVNNGAYDKFLKFYVKCLEDESSIIFRYLRIGNLEMSSGERAFQNILSWLYIMPFYDKFTNDIQIPMKKNILLLIDELDLYMHPEWQRNIISYLLEEIEQQYQGYKVQLIFTTHSPLCLSDIPVENTIYIDKSEGKINIEDRNKKKQTFGRDIYTLLNDAFYLENQSMGLYAKTYINSIIEQIIDVKKIGKKNKYRKISNEDIFNLQEKIHYIGNIPLKMKLETMIKNCSDSKEDEIRLIQSQIKELEKKLAEIGAEE